VFKPERDMAFAALELLRLGRIKKLHIMKSGFDFPISGLFKPMLFNLSPHFEANSVFVQSVLPREDVAFCAGWSNWRKNVHANLLGAALSPRITKIWHHAVDVALPLPLSKKLVHKPYYSREGTFQLIAQAALFLNVSISDCHPMVNLEAAAFGRPCLRGPLHLDALEDHPYIKLTQINSPSAVSLYAQTINNLLDMSEFERREITLDYQKQSDVVARNRYKEFLEI
jgi:hypothetical protein